jgi:hypothetical protein
MKYSHADRGSKKIERTTEKSCKSRNADGWMDGSDCSVIKYLFMEELNPPENNSMNRQNFIVL